jgi:hypothetical protein
MGKLNAFYEVLTAILVIFTAYYAEDWDTFCPKRW